MVNLIRNELVKIFKKKSLYITFLIIFIFMGLLTGLMKYVMTSNNDGIIIGYESYGEITKEELNNLNSNNNSDINRYLEIKTEMDVSDLTKKFGTNSWQTEIVRKKGYAYIYDVNKYTEGVYKNEELLKESQEKYDIFLGKLNGNNWKYFAEEELNEANAELINLKTQLDTIEDKQVLANIEKQIPPAELKVEIAKMRISENISYGNNYLNNALMTYQGITDTIRDYKEDTFSSKQEYYTNLEMQAKNKYIIDNKVDIYNAGFNMIIEDVFSEYSLFIVIIIVMIAGSIVADEFSKGTIKLLLVRPHKRTKILLAKFITVMIMIIFTMLVIFIVQLILGGIFFGFDTLRMLIPVYDFNKMELIEINTFAYIFTHAIANLPYFILIAAITFAVSAIITHTALAITIGMLSYMFADLINMLIVQYNIKFMNFFISMNWNIEQYLFGKLPPVEDINFAFSIAMCIIYFLALTIPTFIIFKKKNIKNV